MPDLELTINQAAQIAALPEQLGALEQDAGP